MNFFSSSKPQADPPAAAPGPATTIGAVAPVSQYPRTSYSKWAQALVWLNCASLVVCGFLTFVFACIRPKRVSHFFLSIYMMTFGALCVMAELRLPIAERMFGILCTKAGLAYCFIFVGTLGISFWVGTYAGVLIPFISGIFSVVIGGLCITDKLMNPQGAGSTRATETTVV
ncbi:putative COP1-associated protein [Leptomonas pyrrhocoris]|uniref:Putative COP1-associated protein n=1 Tax=Leptomonas pyrrhocoris TaxID=157538 RepID=A0A0M9G9W4_LEPPY|nr:putative COP1-associated protein [Leptomonas pyrrhocoris]XP_015664319.1 putative COP1-associated protein [Leptomonas pyrrhocoris]KPA85879.1 putative COP1-associated protein [Leptomonas pyrrhocoris]KPA85880.1 putative COP1-associated protein [Leptomonas pyrrhocoris]|eukprot:XP_015664318.1 putative COP1-associated protein [Leptomonas pyrrhocoris]